jgi:hypothetical protein
MKMWVLVHVKSSLGMNPKPKDSIEDPFRYETWLGSVHIGLHVRVQGTIIASGYVSVTALLLASSSK